MQTEQISNKGTGLLTFTGIGFLLIGLWRLVEGTALTFLIPSAMKHLTPAKWSEWHFSTSQVQTVGMKPVIILATIYLTVSFVVNLLYVILCLQNRKNPRAKGKVILFSGLYFIITLLILVVSGNFAFLFSLLNSMLMFLAGLLMGKIKRQPEYRPMQNPAGFMNKNSFDTGIKRPDLR